MAKRIPVIEHLIRKHKKVGDCWIWQGAPARKGYGAVSVGRGKTITAHRAAYETFVGPIPPGKIICHKCNVALCINPAHLYAGTVLDNAMDRRNAGGYAPRRKQC